MANREHRIHVEVIYEDNHLIAVNKPAGVLVHGDDTGDVTLADAVKEYIKIRYKKPGDVFLGVIHRLDRPVSGVVVFARTSKALTRMNQLFKERAIQKTYYAIVNQTPDPLEGKLVHYITKDHKKNVAKASLNAKKGGKKATLSYELFKGLDGYYLLKVFPDTGRPHQIRVQLASMGCPIVGDLKYGFSRWNEDRSICLHCKSLEFIHPVKKEPVKIEADVPNWVFWKLFDLNH